MHPKLILLIVASLIGLSNSYGQGQAQRQQGQFNDVPILHLAPTLPHYSGSQQGFDQHNTKSNPSVYTPMQTAGPQYNRPQDGVYTNQGKGVQSGYEGQNSRDSTNGHTPEYHQQDIDVRRNQGFNQNGFDVNRNQGFNQQSYDFNRNQGFNQQAFDVNRNQGINQHGFDANRNPGFNQQGFEVNRNQGFNHQTGNRQRPGLQQNYGSPSRHDQFNSREYGQGFDRRYEQQPHQHRPHSQPHMHY